MTARPQNSRDVIVNLLSETRRPMRVDEIVKTLKLRGEWYADDTIRMGICNLYKEGRITRVGHGIYSGRNNDSRS